MEISLEKWQNDLLLEKMGYIKETVRSYYCPYITDEYNENDLVPFDITIAYKDGERPKELENNYPSLSELVKYKEENALKKVINDLMFKTLINNI